MFKAAYDANAEDVLLTIMRKLAGRGIDLSPAPTSHSYAPTLAAKEPEAKGLPKSALSGALNRLQDTGRVRVETVGRRGREKSVLRVGLSS